MHSTTSPRGCGFSRVPNVAIDRLDSLGCVAIKVYLRLCRSASPNGTSRVLRETLAAKAGVTVRAVSMALTELSEAKLISAKRSKFASTYTLLDWPTQEGNCGSHLESRREAEFPSKNQEGNCGSRKKGTVVPPYQDYCIQDKKREAAPAPPKSKPSKEKLNPPFEDLLSKWNAIDGMARCLKATDNRLRAYRARMADDDWAANLNEALAKVAESAFCRGVNDRGWRADIDWLLKPDTLTKILEGKYDDRNNATESTGPQYEVLEPLR